MLYVLSIGPMAAWLDWARTYETTDEWFYQDRLDFYYNLYEPLFWLRILEGRTLFVGDFLILYTSWWGNAYPFPGKASYGLWPEEREAALEQLLIFTRVLLCTWMGMVFLVGGTWAYRRQRKQALIQPKAEAA